MKKVMLVVFDEMGGESKRLHRGNKKTRRSGLLLSLFRGRVTFKVEFKLFWPCLIEISLDNELLVVGYAFDKAVGLIKENDI